MSSALAYRSPEAVIYPEVRYEDCGDIVDEILKRIGNIEADVSKLKVDVGVIASNYATKSDIAEVKTSIADLKGELKVETAGLRTEIASMESRIIKWIVGTTLATAGVVFSIARFVH